jgi:glycerophosphoryl diester phosphodiesterase
MAGLDWLVRRPVAHRGLHDAASGVIENSPSAVAAAVAADYAIEVDLQISADGEAMVHHDGELGRLQDGSGRLDALAASTLQGSLYRGTSDRMMTLADLLALVGGRVALVIEMKSRFDGDPRLPARVAEVLKSYAGPVAAMSFDPRQMDMLQAVAPGLPRGMVAQRMRGRTKSPEHPGGIRATFAYLVQGVRSRPHFVAYNVQDLPAAGPLMARYLLGMPLLTWTVRTADDRARAGRWADQMIFEGFRP